MQFVVFFFIIMYNGIWRQIDFFSTVLTTLRVSIMECHLTGSYDDKYFHDKIYCEPVFSGNFSLLATILP